jgi:anti-sigma factor RsiW
MSGELPASCARVRGRLDRHLDGALAPLDAARDAGHLETCLACRAEELRERALLRAIRSASASDPEELALALRAVRREIDALREPGRLARRLAPLAAALALSAAASIALLALHAAGLAARPRLALPRVPSALGAAEVRLPVWPERWPLGLDGDEGGLR